MLAVIPTSAIAIIVEIVVAIERGPVVVVKYGRKGSNYDMR